MICLEEVLKTSLHDVLKMSWRRFCKTSWRRFEGVFKTSYQDALKMSWRRFCKRSWRRLEDVLNTSWQDVLKTYDQDEYIGLDQGLEDVFWRRMSKANMFVLIKTSWRCLQDVFKRSSSRRMFAGIVLFRALLKILKFGGSKLFKKNLITARKNWFFG